jgi:cytochrome c-type biogenesis protein CcmH
MVFWILVALLSAAVTYFVTRPLLQPAETLADASEADTAVYKDQLTEIDADEARGTISPSEAVAARIEVGRRVLRKTDAKLLPRPEANQDASQATPAASVTKPIHFATTLALPLVSLALYLTFGAPGLPGLPLDERIAAPVNGANTGDLIAKVEARLRSHPDDGAGWDVIAPVYMAQFKFVEAANAFASAIKILGESPRRLQGFAEARIRAENGLVPEDARKALQSVLASDPKRVEPRIWLALAKEQDGKLTEAAADYRALLAEAPEDANWRGSIQERLTLIENPKAASRDGGTSAPPLAGGPTAGDVTAAQNMTPAERTAMIDRMVNGLAEKLKVNSRDKDGWQKLIKAYQVLGRKDDAIKAVASAKAGLAGDDSAVREIEDFAKALGIGS